MTGRPEAVALPVWDEALLAAALFAVDPAGLGGVVLKALPGPVREHWLALLRAWLPEGAPWRRIPLHVTDGRLLGGLDLTATLRTGRPVAERGLLCESDGGVVLLPMAERLASGTAGRLAAVLDSGEVAVERDGFALRSPARLGVVLLDEGLADEDRPPAALLDRLGFHLDLTPISRRAAVEPAFGAQEVAEARTRLPAVREEPGVVEALCGVAAALGVASLRAPLLALHAARASAALAGRGTVAEDDVALAARLVLAPRATVLPAPPDQAPPEPPQPPPPEQQNEQEAGEDQTVPDKPLEDVVLEAAQAAIPAGLLAALMQAGGALTRSRAQTGRAGQLRQGSLRGRPAGVRSGEPRAGARLNVVETLRAAAPWQGLRRREHGKPDSRRVQVRSEDFRVTRFKERSQTTTVFLVDASGSSALHRLAEAKGAVELLLADCYVRRDRVALIAFRGREAELLLPPTRSLVRAKRSLAGLPGGGGTPLAAGLDAAGQLTETLRRRGETPTLVLLTDGRANIARDGTPGREQAAREALDTARRLRGTGLRTLLVDTSPQPRASAAELAQALGARYLPLPHADARALGRAVRAATASG